jgi:hypothetical protein
LVSFLMLSLPAISQSVTIVNGDTLICLPDSLTRKVIADLEAGDLCKIELASWITEAKGLRDVIDIQKEQIAVKDKAIKTLNETITEKKLQLETREKEIAVLKTDKAANYWKGLLTGLGTGAGIVLVLTLL